MENKRVVDGSHGLARVVRAVVETQQCEMKRCSSFLLLLTLLED